jgi:hypothetical protein
MLSLMSCSFIIMGFFSPWLLYVMNFRHHTQLEKISGSQEQQTPSPGPQVADGGMASSYAG